MAKHHLYDQSPAIEHDEHGSTRVRKPPKREMEPSGTERGDKAEGFNYDKGEGMPDHVRHAMDRHHLHVRHEHEHALHDHHHPHISKEHMHERHEREFKEMHTRHEKEDSHDAGAESGRGGATGKRSEPIEKAEKGTRG